MMIVGWEEKRKEKETDLNKGCLQKPASNSGDICGDDF